MRLYWQTILGGPWPLGRQGTGYQSKKLADGGNFDVYLIKYPIGSYVPTHTDPVKGKRHFRLNIRLKGEDKFTGDALLKFWRVCLFRPDIMPHSVHNVKSERLMLSIGWAIK